MSRQLYQAMKQGQDTWSLHAHIDPLSCGICKVRQAGQKPKVIQEAAGERMGSGSHLQSCCSPYLNPKVASCDVTSMCDVMMSSPQQCCPWKQYQNWPPPSWAFPILSPMHLAGNLVMMPHPLLSNVPSFYYYNYCYKLLPLQALPELAYNLVQDK